MPKKPVYNNRTRKKTALIRSTQPWGHPAEGVSFRLGSDEVGSAARYCRLGSAAESGMAEPQEPRWRRRRWWSWACWIVEEL
jgi:hypothetical protein